MFKNMKSKKILVSSLVVLMLISTVAFAANEIFNKTLTATHGRLKLSYQGEDITKAVEEKYETPAFTVKEYDSRAYVPVRAIADIMGVSVTYDNLTHTADFVDVEKLALEKQVEIKDAEILRLEAKIKLLENKVVKEEEEKKEEPKNSLADLEKKLNKDYGYVDSVDFNIVLKESGSQITANLFMETRSSTERSDWIRMGTPNKKKLMENIADDIRKEFNTYNIKGSIYDNYEKDTLYEFSMSSSGNVSITDRDYRSGGSYGSNDLLDESKYYLDSYLRELGYIDRIDLREIRTDEISGTVEFDDYRSSRRPSDTDIRYAIQDALDDVEYKLDTRIYFNIEVYYGNESLGIFRY